MKISLSTDDNYDFSIFSLSYESRARFYAEKNIGKLGTVFVLGYNFNHTLSYPKNKNFFESIKATVLDIDDCDIYSFLEQNIPVHTCEKSFSVLFDITSMSRHRVASILFWLASNLPKGSNINIVYSHAEYSKPPKVSPPVNYIGPICHGLSGGLGDLEMPTSCLISLGYEENKALGAVNSIDPGDVWLIVPKSDEIQYEKKVRENNSSLMNLVSDEKILTMNIHDPGSIYRDMRSLIQGIIRTNRPIVLPLGPKVFTAIATLIAYEFYPNIPVWRVSSHDKEIPVDRVATGNIIHFSLAL